MLSSQNPDDWFFLIFFLPILHFKIKQIYAKLIHKIPKIIQNIEDFLFKWECVIYFSATKVQMPKDAQKYISKNISGVES